MRLVLCALRDSVLCTLHSAPCTLPVPLGVLAVLAVSSFWFRSETMMSLWCSSDLIRFRTLGVLDVFGGESLPVLFYPRETPGNKT
jgi:hypothetical protein